MEIRVLGPTEISHDGAPVAVRRGRAREILAILVAAYPHGIAADALIEAIWPDKDQPRGLNNLRVNVKHLRDELPARDLVEHEAGRYRLRVADTDLDLRRFELHVEAGRAAATAGDPRSAAVFLESGFAEWRGEPFADFPDLRGLASPRHRLAETYFDAMCEYAAVLIADDRADQAVRALTPVLEADLTREAVAEQLMIALNLTGRPGDALRVFGRVVEALDQELLAEPSPRFVERRDEIVLHRDTGSGPGRRGERRPAPVIRPRRPANFIGRADELDALGRAWGDAESGAPQLAVVAAVAGMGKTTLLRRFVADITARGGTAVVGTCEQDPRETYVPFPELVRGALTLPESVDTAPALLGELTRLAPDLGGRLPPPPSTGPIEPGGGRQRLFRSVADLLGAPVGPRLVVIEDMHWVRADAMEMFRHLLRRAQGQVMVVLTYRPDELDVDHPLAQSMQHGRLSRPDLHIQLEPMNRHELVSLIDAVAPIERRNEFQGAVDDLLEISAGNPLRLCEVLRQLDLEPETPIDAIIPEDVRSLVERRLATLDAVARRVLRFGAVLGRVFTLPIVAAASSTPVEDTLDALDDAIRAGLVVAGDAVDNYVFAHPLIHNAVYYGQVPGRRARAHVRCAEVLGAEASTTGTTRSPEIAGHLVAGRPLSDPELTWRAAMQAGDDALDRFAHVEAVAWYRDALGDQAWSGGQCALGELELRLAVACGHSGDLAASRAGCLRVADLARQLGDDKLLLAAVEAATPRETVLDEDFARTLGALADEALARLDPDDATRIVALKAAASARAYVSFELVDGYAAEASRLARRTSDPPLVHAARVLQYFAALNQESDDRLDIARELCAHAAHHGLAVEYGQAQRRLLVQLLDAGLGDEFDARLVELDESSRATSIPDQIYWAAALQATRHLMIDATPEAEQIITRAARLGAQLQVPLWDGLQTIQMYALRYQQGRSRELSAQLADPKPTDPPVMAGTGLLALTHTEAGRLDAARAILDRAVTDERVVLPQDNFTFCGTALFAGVAARGGRPAQRRVLRVALEPRLGRFCAFGSGGPVFGTTEHWMAELALSDGDTDSAEILLVRAVEMCEAAGATFWAVRAQQRLADIRSP